jgi:hypothetical protein
VKLLIGGGICALAVGLMACGSSGPSQAVTSNASAGKSATAAVKPKTRLTVVAPTRSAVVRTARVSVRGTVVPQDAHVQVLGKEAKVTDGAFTATAGLNMGPNAVDIVATVAGADPVTTTVSVMRGRTSAQVAAAAAAKRKREAARAAARRKREQTAAAQRAAAAKATLAVPDETGERLDVAEDDLRSHGLRYSEIGGGTFGVVVPSNWTVCEMRPGPGAQVKKHTRVKLVIDREC